MSFRLLGYALLLILMVAFMASVTAPSQQIPDDKFTGPRWEYKVLRLDSPACREGDLATPLNNLGRQGWELVTSEQPAPPFPKDVTGSMVTAPAATGPSRGVTPPTADSFETNLTMRMGQVAQPGCRFVFMREWHPPTSR